MAKTKEATARVLVVDDDPQLSLFLSRLLESNGFSVATADDGVEGLEKIQKEKFDLVLLDVYMPRMNGLDMLGRLRNQPAPPRVVVMTAYDTPDTLLRAAKEQAHHYIIKPFEPRTVIDVVRDALSAPRTPSAIEVVSARPNWVEILVPCQIEAVERVEGFLARLKTDLPQDVRESVGKVFRELLLNAIEWGGKLDPTRKVRIAYLRARRMLLYRIADPGAGFRFEDLSHEAVRNPPNGSSDHPRPGKPTGQRPGGFGLLLAKVAVDELIYNEARNEVVIVKYLD
jgi:CheY-like chemotaxis protein/anti-sigma regulatory factor (Ser/Thr protein kinase)